MSQRQLHLGLFLQETGHHVAGWRQAGAHADAALDFRRIIAQARLAEAACFDLVFIQDSYAMRGAADLAALSATARALTWDPLTALSALASVTERIGLVGTATTTYNEPYAIARQFACLDHLSGGRAGWNLVTSNNEAEARNFSRDVHAAHADRYARAAEFLDVVKGLWDTWEDDAFVLDTAAGQFFDPARLHTLNHQGPHFSVRGPLTVARPPQGHPVLVQAGSSPAGKALGARSADVIFTAQQDAEAARAFRADLQALAAAHGRTHGPRVMPGLVPVIGATRDEARETYDALQDSVPDAVGMATLATTLGEVDLSGYTPDDPLPTLPATNGPTSRRELLVALARRDDLTLRQLWRHVTGARGHLTVVGTAADVADVMQDWLEREAADGFNIMPGALPVGLEAFAAHVVPELRRRGLFRTQYAARTLREHLGLARPEHPHAR